MKESDLVRKIMDAVKAKYPRAYARKLSDRYNRGIPDILIVYPRNGVINNICGVLFVETKTATGKTAKIQDVEMAAINDVCAYGCDAIVSRDSQDVLDFLEAAGAQE